MQSQHKASVRETGIFRSRKTRHGENGSAAVSVAEAQRIILNAVKPLGGETISVVESFNRILCEDIVSDIMIPPFDDSAMDGYALIAAGTRGASKSKPVRLKVTGELRAGASAAGIKVESGGAVRIMTGAPIPQGADSVVPFENTKEKAGYVSIFSESVEDSNCKRAGENIKKGDKVLQKGDRLRSADVGILASLGYDTVRVYKRPDVSIISTGDELAEVGEKIGIGQIRNVNAYMLYSEVRKYNAIPHYLGIAKDTKEETKVKLLEALEADVVISTGGVSMGKYDFIKEVYSELGIEILFEWINVKPGKPCTFGKKGSKLVFGLPGYPVPTLTSFIEFVRPALLKLMGAKKLNKPVVSAFLEEDVSKRSGAVNLLRGRFTIRNDEFYVSTTGNQKSSELRSMSKANCLIVIPESSTKIRAGEKVAIQLIDHDEI